MSIHESRDEDGFVGGSFGLDAPELLDLAICEPTRPLRYFTCPPQALPSDREPRYFVLRHPLSRAPISTDTDWAAMILELSGLGKGQRHRIKEAVGNARRVLTPLHDLGRTHKRVLEVAVAARALLATCNPIVTADILFSEPVPWSTPTMLSFERMQSMIPEGAVRVRGRGECTLHPTLGLPRVTGAARLIQLSQFGELLGIPWYVSPRQITSTADGDALITASARLVVDRYWPRENRGQVLAQRLVPFLNSPHFLWSHHENGFVNDCLRSRYGGWSSMDSLSYALVAAQLHGRRRPNAPIFETIAHSLLHYTSGYGTIHEPPDVAFPSGRAPSGVAHTPLGRALVQEVVDHQGGALVRKPRWTSRYVRGFAHHVAAAEMEIREFLYVDILRSAIWFDPEYVRSLRRDGASLPKCNVIIGSVIGDRGPT